MTPTEQEQETIKRLAKGPDGDFLISFCNRIISYYADVRKMKDLTTEQVKARQLACEILEEELVNRLVRNQNIIKKQKITEEYE